MIVKDILELVKLLIQGKMNVAVHVTVTGTVDIKDPDGNYLVFVAPTETSTTPVT